MCESCPRCQHCEINRAAFKWYGEPLCEDCLTTAVTITFWDLVSEDGELIQWEEQMDSVFGRMD
jgi:hypothetical protein